MLESNSQQTDLNQKQKQELYNKALVTVKKNLIETQEGLFFTAGAHQFKTLWVRDFCYSVPGLLNAGFTDHVENQLKLIFKFWKQNSNSSYLIPRGIDVTDPKLRVLWNTFFQGSDFPKSYKTNKLKPEYLGEHKTPAYDSNLLFLKACFQLHKHTGKDFLLSREQVESLISFYKPQKNGLFIQPSFSDWQDSAKRNGPLLLTHLLYLEVLGQTHSIYPNLIKDFSSLYLAKRIVESFFDPNTELFVEDLGQDKSTPQFSLDSHCLILSNPDLLPQIDHNKLFLTLKNSPLWKSRLIPGVPVYPVHNPDKVSWTTKAVGLRHYHDLFHWGWLVAEAYKLCVIYSDPTEAQKIMTTFYRANYNSKYLAEIYELKDTNLTPQKGFLYQSECPFTWTAAKWLESFTISV